MKKLETRDWMALLPVWGFSGLLLLVSVHRVQGQVAGAHSLSANASNCHMSITSSGPAVQETFREIDDPNSGARWLLLRDQQNPGGPGRMVQAGEVREGIAATPAAKAASVEPNPPRPIIHAGDLLIVEESTPVVAAQLEAVALGPATVGSSVEVRLRIGGRIVRAKALGPGRAALQPEYGARP